MKPLSSLEVFMLLVLTLALCVLGAIALAIEIGKEVTRVYRRRQLRRELESLGVPRRASSPSLPNRGRSALAWPEVRPLRVGESRDPPAPRVLAFTERLEAEGRYVHELGIHKRLN